ncbi:hypothetical protein ACHAXA_002076 [Cyclostephanos tholiformis]|uniref:ANK_REP_REGION domain-containing protein n=1 Tax=Cyclostephanos tholiformis TaxID=382380 RepID=A0ABD3SSJ4_9STRA
MSVACLRKSICSVIESAGTTDIVSELDNIFLNYESLGSDWCEEGDNVTPLMLACDKCNSEALIYLRNQMSAFTNYSQPTDLLIDAWGHPDEASSHGNRASHHALAAGFSEGLDLLENIWGFFEEESHGGRLRRYLSLLSQTNHNGDTPLMMACVNGRDDVVQCLLQRSVQLALSTRPADTKATVNETWQLLKDIFRMRNSEECTALNLASGHGHPGIVKILIEPHNIELNSNDESVEANLIFGEKKNTMADEANETNSTVHKLNPLAEVTFTDIDFCKKTLGDLDTRLKFKDRFKVAVIEKISLQRKNTNECLAMMEVELDRLATNAANELLLLENLSTTSIAIPIIFKGTSKRVKIKKRQRRNTRGKRGIDAGVPDSVVDATRSDSATGENCWDFVKNEPKTGEFSLQSSPFVTLQDGTLISKHQKSEFDSHIDILADKASFDNVITDESNINKEAKTFQRILTHSISKTDCEKAALMESLCLNPAMLLLSPHGMAVDMSPCQLDAIESILNHQLKATKEAQKIQRRLLKK